MFLVIEKEEERTPCTWHVLKNETEHGGQSRTNKNTNTDTRSGARETRHHHATKNGGAEEHEHGEDTKETRGGVDTEHGRSIKRRRR